ncbi:MAG: hypothetical protein Q9201_002659 [Fulgogasparrea decipioides]
MHASIPLTLAISTLCIKNTMAAPAALPPNARNVAPTQSTSPPATSTTSNLYAQTVTPKPIRRRMPQNNFGGLEDLVFPQMISSSPTSSSASTAFEFVVTHHPKPTGRAVTLAAEDPAQEAQKRDENFGLLGELSFPQKISASPSAPPSATATKGSIPTQGSISFDL